MIFKNILIELVYMFAPRKRLEYYVTHNNVGKVERLLKKGVNPNPTKRQMRNAALHPFYPLLFQSLSCPSSDMVKTLLNNSANPYATYCCMKFRGEDWFFVDFEDISLLEYFVARLRNPLIENRQWEPQKNLEVYILLRQHWGLDGKIKSWVMSADQPYSPSSFALFQKWEDELLMHQQNTRILESINNECSNRARRKM